MQEYLEWLSLLSESKQDIVNLGYPEVVAGLFYKRFEKHPVLFAKWYRDYHTNDPGTNWWLWTHGNFRTFSLADKTELYAATRSPEEYIKMLDHLGLERDEDWTYDESYLEEKRAELAAQIEAELFGKSFFSNNTLIADIESGKLRDVAPYKKLPFWDAQKKYDAKQVFRDREPIKAYRDGMRWIDVGKRCHLVGHLMKNCGSAGVMSGDPDRTMIALFDTNNKPHVVVTHSSNEKRISGDEGVASTPVKDEYHTYVLDLAKILGARFDYDKSKSIALGTKYLLQGKASNLQRVPGGGLFDDFFVFDMDGKKYYANRMFAVSAQEVDAAEQALRSGEGKIKNVEPQMIKNVFNHHNKSDFEQLGVRYIPLTQIAEKSD